MTLLTHFRNMKETNYADARVTSNIKQILKNPQLFFNHKKVKRVKVEFIKKSDIEEYKITFPSALQTKYSENNLVHAWYKKPQHERGIVILLHGWKIDSQIVYKLTIKNFLDANYGVVFLELPYHMHRTPAQSYSGEYFITANLQRTIDAYRQAVLDVRCCIDYFTTKTKKRTRNIALWGTSLGAMIATLTLPFDQRVKAVVSVVGGGNIAGICWNGVSTQQVKRDCVQHNISFETIENYWKIIDPLTYATKKLKNCVLMINAEKDEYISPVYTKQLWERLGKPKIVWLPMGHLGFIMHFKKGMKETLKFIEERFKG